MWIRQLDERLQKEFKKVPQCTRGQWGTFRLHVGYLRSRGTTRVATVVAKCWRVHKKVIHKHEEFLVSQLLHRFTHDTSCKVAPKMEGYITCSQTEDCQGPPTEFYGRYLWMLLMVCTCTRFPIILVGADTQLFFSLLLLSETLPLHPCQIQSITNHNYKCFRYKLWAAGKDVGGGQKSVKNIKHGQQTERHNWSTYIHTYIGLKP